MAEKSTGGKKVPKISDKTGNVVRDWTLEQRAALSIKKSGGQLVRDTIQGRQHFALVRHLTETNRLECYLAFEANLNNTTLEEWITRHRLEGKPKGNEIYLPSGVSIIPLDGDFYNCSPENLYCFPSTGERQRWQYYHERSKEGKCPPPVLPDTREKVREIAINYTRVRKNTLEVKRAQAERLAR
jgi:hypothetical protein